MTSDLESVHKSEVPCAPSVQVVDALAVLRGCMVMLNADALRLGHDAKTVVFRGQLAAVEVP